jgi:hypothetical protein
MADFCVALLASSCGVRIVRLSTHFRGYPLSSHALKSSHFEHPAVFSRAFFGLCGRAGTTTLEFIVSATIGFVVTGAALVLCAAGNRAVTRIATSEAAWQEARAALTQWAADWRGSGYDPTLGSGAGVTRLGPDTMEFSADWNADGSLLPTASNPNERLAYAIAPGVFRRGINGGPRLAAAWPDSARFSFRDASGGDLGPSPYPAAVRIAVARLALPRSGSRPPPVVEWTASRRNP